MHETRVWWWEEKETPTALGSICEQEEDTLGRGDTKKVEWRDTIKSNSQGPCGAAGPTLSKVSLNPTHI